MSYKINFFGHAAFSISGNGQEIYIDPWIQNPKCPEPFTDLSKHHPTAILLTHGHNDHFGNTIDLLKQNPSAKLYAIFDLIDLVSAVPGVAPEQLVGLNKGGTVAIGGGFTATFVTALHSSTYDGKFAGEAGAWIIHTPDGKHTIYHTGDTDVFGDMRIINDLWQPDIAMVCIGDHFTMGPKSAAYAIAELMPSLKTVIPMHYGTFPALTGTPEKLEEFLRERKSQTKVNAVAPGAFTEL